ncbi:hypothetical protein GCM10010254_75260 [Streptomyces chromofuscus]|nr:hypothetical protein GCM10010254_75260 [Streptomyces chromofuscus]
MAVTVDGTRDILGIWAGDGGEGAKHWLQAFAELKNRGVEDVLMLVCDGLKGLPDAVETVWPRTVVRTCIVHLIRNSIRYCARQDWDKVAKDLKPVYTAPSEAAATERFLEFSEKWGGKYPAVIKLWSDAWAEMVPFLSFDVEIRKVICSTNAIESVNARIRKAVRARSHFPSEAAALKCVYMALMSLDPTGKGRRRWTMRWKAPQNAFQIAFDGRARKAAEIEQRRAEGLPVQSAAGALSEERREQLDEIDPAWCPAWPVEWQRCFHLVRLLLEEGGELPTAPGVVVRQGEDLGRWVRSVRLGWDKLTSVQQ